MKKRSLNWINMELNKGMLSYLEILIQQKITQSQVFKLFINKYSILFI